MSVTKQHRQPASGAPGAGPDVILPGDATAADVAAALARPPVMPVADPPPPPPEVSATFAPNVPDDARAQRLNETPAGRGVVIPEGPTDG